MKKNILLIVLLSFSFLNFSFSEDFPYVISKPTTNNDFIEKDNSSMKKIAESFLWEEVDQDYPASYYISKVINYFLAILAFISILTILYGFSFVFFDKTEEWMKKWYKFIKISIIALVAIWVSWLISMWFFGIYSNI